VGAGSVATTCSPCDLPDEIIAKCDAMLLLLQNVLAFDGGILSGSPTCIFNISFAFRPVVAGLGRDGLKTDGCAKAILYLLPSF
jgi:hypothetical protein